MSKILNWTLGSFFRTLGRILVYLFIGYILFNFLNLSNIKIPNLFTILDVNADEKPMFEEFYLNGTRMYQDRSIWLNSSENRTLKIESNLIDSIAETKQYAFVSYIAYDELVTYYSNNVNSLVGYDTKVLRNFYNSQLQGTIRYFVFEPKWGCSVQGLNCTWTGNIVFYGTTSDYQLLDWGLSDEPIRVDSASGELISQNNQIITQNGQIINQNNQIISGQQSIINNQNANSQAEINNANQNKNDIINNQNSNSQAEINNANQNSQAEIQNANENTNKTIDSQKVCKNIRYNNSVSKEDGFIKDDGTISTISGYYHTSEYIGIDKGESYKLQLNYEVSAPSYCIYDINKTLKYCERYNARTEINIVPTENGYIKYSLLINSNDSNTIFTGKVCKNGNQATNDTLNDMNSSINNSDSSQATNDASNFFSNFTTDTHGLTGIITAPLSAIQSLSSQQCSPLILPLPFVNENLTLPCMRDIYTQYFGDFMTLYDIITLGIISYWVMVRIFGLVKDFKNPEHDEIEVLDL